MRYRGLDANGDFMMGQGVGSYAQGKAAISLDIAARLRSWRGGCFFAPADGVDYVNLLQKGQEQNLIAALQNRVLQTQGVVQIVSMPVNFDARSRSLSVGPITVQTIYGQVFLAQLNNLTGGSLSA